MSGPKYSYAKVDTERLKRQIAEMEAKVEKIKCENIRRKISLLIKKTDSNISINSIEDLNSFITKAEKIIQDSKNINCFKKLIDDYSKLKNDVPALIGNSAELTSIQKQYEERYMSISNIISMLKFYGNNIEHDCDLALISKKEEEYINSDWEGIHDNISVIPEKLLKEYNNLLNEILYYENFETIKKDIDSIISNHALDDEYKIIQMKIRIDAAKVEKNASTDVIEHLQLTNDYISLCEVLGKPVDTVPIEIEELRIAVQKLEEELHEVTMMQYVSESLKASMEKLGYTIIGHEEVKNKNQCIDKNYYDYTSNSVINLSTSKNGAVLFEVMGKCNDLNDNQKERIKCDMEKFCPDYDAVKSELSKYGVILERENLYAPDVKYVRGIEINDNSTPNNRRKNNKKQLGMMEND